MEIVTPRSSGLVRLLTAVCFATVVCGCESADESQTVPSPGLPHDASIEFARDACYGTCPVFAVTLRSNGTLRWVGRSNVAAIGERQGVAPSSDVLRLFTLLDDARFDNWFVGEPSKQFAQRVEADGIIHVWLERVLDRQETHLTVTRSGISRRLTYGLPRARLIAVETALLNLDKVPLWIGAKRTSASVALGKPFTYTVGHCGLRDVVEFDGSYWDVDLSTVDGDEDARFGINSDMGTMTLVSADQAVYRSSRGGEATLHRHVGPKEFARCF